MSESESVSDVSLRLRVGGIMQRVTGLQVKCLAVVYCCRYKNHSSLLRLAAAAPVKIWITSWKERRRCTVCFVLRAALGGFSFVSGNLTLAILNFTGALALWPQLLLRGHFLFHWRWFQSQSSVVHTVLSLRWRASNHRNQFISRCLVILAEAFCCPGQSDSRNGWKMWRSAGTNAVNIWIRLRRAF